MAEGLDGAELQAQVAEFGLVGEDVVFSVGELASSFLLLCIRKRDWMDVQVGRLLFEV